MGTRSMAVSILATAAVVLLATLLVVTVAGAQPGAGGPTLTQVSYPITYQGRLTDNTGTPLANQTVNITFRIYQQQTGGSALWTQTHSVTTDPSGLFATTLNIDPPLGVTDLSNVWLGIEVGADGEMSPRQQVGGAAFAFTLVPGNGVTGSIDLGTWPNAIFSISNSGSGHGLVVQATGQGVGVFGSSKTGIGGYFTSEEGHALAVDGPILSDTNLKKMALHRWYEVNEAGITLPVGAEPRGIVFDGSSVWVSNSISNTLTRRRVSDGDLMGTYRVGTYPIGMAYDGLRLWVANRGDNTVSRILASNPLISTTVAVGAQPNSVCFDGKYVWVANEGNDNVTRLIAATGAASGNFPVGDSPRFCFFDGTNVWVTNYGSNTVTVLKKSDGSFVRTVNVGTNPVAGVFDGADLWVVNSGSNDVTKIRASDGQVLGTFAVGLGPRAASFDGFYIWVTNETDGTVTRLRARDGAASGTYAVGAEPRGITFDGSDIWIVNGGSDNICKM